LLGLQVLAFLWFLDRYRRIRPAQAAAT